ncbi:MAG: glycosyltransferase family 4 protein [Holophagaceae bacterium]|nr:glycosyltransferase family 4 protein [Holophagaceae bacterium]
MTKTSPLSRRRIAIVISHPIQYYGPWFAHLATQPGIELKVFYLWDSGAEARFDPEFGHTIAWDIPLLEGYDHVFIPNRSRRPGSDHFRGLDNPGLVPALEAWRPDAILLFGFAYLSHLRVILSRRLSRIPLLLRGDSHNLVRPSGWGPTLKRWLRVLLFRRFSAFLAVGRANADYYRSCGVPEARIQRVPHCVDNQRFQLAAPAAEAEATAWKLQLGIPQGAPVILFAGKLEDQKRPMDLLEAFLRVQERVVVAGRPGPVLLFVGSGAWHERLQARSGDRVGQSVFFAPFQNQTRMPMVYAACDLLVLPSESETWGLAVNEAMNLATPVIVSSHVGCGPDLVQSGVTGWIFRAGDVEELAQTLAGALVGGKEQLSALGLNALHRMAEYSYESATRGLLPALDRISPEIRSS